MRTHLGWCPSIVFGLLLALAERAAAQEALQVSVAGEQMAALRRRALENPVANVQLGPVNLLFGTSVGLEWNDNVNYTDQDRQQDIIIYPGFNLSGSVPLTEANALYANFDLAYAKYLHYSQYDRFLLHPGSELGFDVYVKDFHFNLHDRITVSDEPFAQGSISQAGNYGEFSNLIGLGIDWDLNDVIFSFGYDHQTALATTDAYSYLDRSAEFLFARASLQLNDWLTIGPETSAGFTDYDQDVLTDNVNYSLGAFADWQVSSNIRVKPRIGYTAYSYAHPPSPGQSQNFNSFYFDLSVSHRLNDTVSINLEAGHQVRTGIYSELIDIYCLRPRASLALINNAALNLGLNFEDGTDSGSSAYRTAERYTLVGPGIGVSWQALEKVALSLAYDYVWKQSDVAAYTYHLNRIQLRAQYTF